MPMDFVGRPIGAVTDSVFALIGDVTPSKRLVFQVDNQAVSTTLTLNTGAQTASRQLSVPVLTGDRTIAVIDQAQTFTAAQTFGSTITASNDGAVATTLHALVQYNATAAASPTLSIGHGRGTAGSPSATLNSDSLGTIGFAGHTGSFLGIRAGLRGTATEDWGTNRGCRLDIFATATGAASEVTVAQFAGNLITFPQPVAVTNTTASTSTATGAMRVSGGLGVVGAVFAGSLTTSDRLSVNRTDNTAAALRYSIDLTRGNASTTAAAAITTVGDGSNGVTSVGIAFDGATADRYTFARTSFTLASTVTSGLTIAATSGTTLTVSSTSATAISCAGGASFANGLTVSAGTTSVQALSATTGSFSGSITPSQTNGIISGATGNLVRICGGTLNDGAVLLLGGSTQGTLPSKGIGRVGSSDIWSWDTNGIALASGKTLVLPTSTPASASATGTAGTITWDANFLYVCTATNTWKRVAIASW